MLLNDSSSSLQYERKQMSRLIKHKRVWWRLFKPKYDYYEYDDGTTKTVYDNGYKVITTHYGHYITRILPDGRQHTNHWRNEYWPPTSCWKREE